MREAAGVDVYMSMPWGTVLSGVTVLVNVDMDDDLWFTLEPAAITQHCRTLAAEAWPHLEFEEQDTERSQGDETVVVVFGGQPRYAVEATVSWSLAEHKLWGAAKAHRLLRSCDPQLLETVPARLEDLERTHQQLQEWARQQD